MKNAENETDNCTCCADNRKTDRNCTDNSVRDSTQNQGDLREIKNQGDMRDVTDKNGSNNRINMTNY